MKITPRLKGTKNCQKWTWIERRSRVGDLTNTNSHLAKKLFEELWNALKENQAQMQEAAFTLEQAERLELFPELARNVERQHQKYYV